ncbi:MAG: D-alanyl-D-alanine carboxypeptidase family protein [Proteobacteria bacterium]|nr:D-alanyl-D-alanine carboxypeptidase family protein [Pseudomonadota bacterium]MDA0928800.1 D-alanyl-D-alanine carboxypeptidase family protein [Pseudomonadota bacterium]
MSDSYLSKISELHELLGIPASFREECSMPLCHTPAQLVATEPDYYGRPQQLTPEAFAAWSDMKAAAARDGVVIHLISAYRDPDYQCQIFKRKLDAGEPLAAILRVNAAPGYSEHHTGRAIDLGTLDCPALETEFEKTPAFAWLSEHAGTFGFALSYPRDNAHGIGYEPWHWCFMS